MGLFIFNYFKKGDFYESKSYWHQGNGIKAGCAGILALFQNEDQ
jgi:hypothetical protein